MDGTFVGQKFKIFDEMVLVATLAQPKLGGLHSKPPQFQ
jgi:hypothetical protein